MRIAVVIAVVAATLAASPARASCVGPQELAAGSSANFVAHVTEIRPDGEGAVVVVDSVAGGKVRRGQRIEVVDAGRETPVEAHLLLGARYRFRPQGPLSEPLRVNECSADRLGGFVLPADAVRVVERRPGWVVPALVVMFVLGAVAGGLFVQSRPKGA